MSRTDPNGLIFSTVDTFVEQVGRRKQWRWGDLDTLVCTWNGPSAGALQFKPQVNAAHPQYPLMFCTDSQITDQAALIAEVQATYQGIIQWNGKLPYYTPGIVTTSPVQGSLDYQRGYYAKKPLVTPTALGGSTLVPIDPSLPPLPGTPTATYIYLYDVGSQQVTFRWIGQESRVRYQAYPEPKAPVYGHLGLSQASFQLVFEQVGIISVATQVTGYDGVLTWMAQNIPKRPFIDLMLTGFQREQRGRWWNCVESYAPVVLGGQ